MARALRDPSQEEEERRLFYVAVTRARTHLHVTWPLFVPFAGGREQALGQLSRFVDQRTAATMTRIHVAPPADAAHPLEAPDGAPLDVRALLRNRFA
jgi:ATP-dependent exoDNAse (exonuclease V) beta subunit